MSEEKLNETQKALLEALGLRPPTWGQVIWRLAVKAMALVVTGAFLGLGLRLVGVG